MGSRVANLARKKPEFLKSGSIYSTLLVLKKNMGRVLALQNQFHGFSLRFEFLTYFTVVVFQLFFSAV